MSSNFIEALLSNPVDSVYALVGFALFGLTLQPGPAWRYHINLPAVYIGLGAVATSLGFPNISPLGSELQAQSCSARRWLQPILCLPGQLRLAV